jgi:hypothetical protein
MKYNITQTENYLLIGEESEIKAGAWMTNNSDVWQSTNYYGFQPYSKKIIAHLPFNGALVLEGVDLLPKIEDDIEQWGWNNPCLSRKDVYTLFEEVFKEQRLDGQFSISASKQVYEFKSKLRDLAKEKAKVIKEKFKYTDGDLRMFMEIGISYGRQFEWDIQNGNKRVEKHNELFYSNIKYLQQPKMPVAFECYSTREFRIIDLSHQVYYEKVGQTVWVGKYIFND